MCGRAYARFQCDHRELIDESLSGRRGCEIWTRIEKAKARVGRWRVALRDRAHGHHIPDGIGCREVHVRDLTIHPRRRSLVHRPSLRTVVPRDAVLTLERICEARDVALRIR